MLFSIAVAGGKSGTLLARLFNFHRPYEANVPLAGSRPRACQNQPDSRTLSSSVGLEPGARRKMNGSGGDEARIVVGIDGSAGSKEALRWAAQQAKSTGAALEVVIAWHYPVCYGWAPGPQDFDFGEAAEQALTGAIDEVLGSDRPAWLRTRVAEGNAAQVLVDASADADLLVVGSRGYGAFADALLGSVSTYCVHHARCPVTVIRPSGRAAEASGHEPAPA